MLGFAAPVENNRELGVALELKEDESCGWAPARDAAHKLVHGSVPERGHASVCPEGIRGPWQTSTWMKASSLPSVRASCWWSAADCWAAMAEDFARHRDAGCSWQAWTKVWLAVRRPS